MLMLKSIVIKPHKPESDEFIACSTGDVVGFERRETIYPGWIWCTDGSGGQAWVPEAYVSIYGGECRFVRDYVSKELEVDVGQIVTIMEVVSQWAWVLNEGDNKGWVPLACLSPASSNGLSI